MDSVVLKLVEPNRYPGEESLPPEAPLSVAKQDFAYWQPRRAITRWKTSFDVCGARIFVFGTTLVLTAIGTYEVYRVVAVSGVTWLQTVFALLFAITFAWIAFSCSSAFLGFWRILSRTHFGPSFPKEGPTGRVALLMPVYNENPLRIYATLEFMARDLAAHGSSKNFDMFVLSDTRDPVICRLEWAGFQDLAQKLSSVINLYYRRRRDNRHRKAGNIEDFVSHFGAAYDSMIVLDADSTMTGSAMLALARLMQQDKTAGIIQTSPILRDRNSLFARLQQFSSRVYGPAVTYGLAAWHGRDGNYWGHNAIIRVKAFAEAAGLPELEGRKPFGGHVLSHDFVEAALIRRAGYAVYMTPELSGSYEECPPSLVDLAGRDRRWCQGNLQHAKIVGAKGLHWVSRLHLIQGIMSYLASPLWLVFLLLGLGLSAQAQFIRPEYFPDGFALFPKWPVFDPERALHLLIFTMIVLFLPKLLGVVLAALDKNLRRGCGGLAGLLSSLVAETLLSLLLSPVMMFVQSRFVADILLGRDSGWAVQNRHDAALPWWQTVQKHWGHCIAGLAIGVSAFMISWPTLLWLSPIILGLLLAAPVSWASALPSLGMAARRLGIFITPEEQFGNGEFHPAPISPDPFHQAAE